jgi:hypothetical protein
MSAIAAANSSANNAIALLLSNAASSATDTGTPATKATTSGSSASSDPTDIVDLSDHAKATLARAKTDQVAADKLTAQLQAARDPGGKATAPKANSGDGTSLFDKLSGRAQPQQTGDTPQTGDTQQTGNTQWVAGAPYGNAAISDADFTASIKATLLNAANGPNSSPENKQALEAALASGTLKFQKTSDVPDLNFHSSSRFTPSAIGGGFDCAVWTSQNPVGATKDAIDQGAAVAVWSADRGPVYVTW